MNIKTLMKTTFGSGLVLACLFTGPDAFAFGRPKPPTPAFSGHFDGINGTEAVGWAALPSDPAAAVEVHFYDGPASAGRLIGSTVANLPRGGLPVAGNHGFSFQIPAELQDGDSHPIHAYAVAAGKSALLGGSPRAFTGGRAFDEKEAVNAAKRAYRAVLFREGDDGGLNGFRDQVMREGKAGLRRAFEGMAASDEFRQNVRPARSDEELVAQLYRKLLLREPDDFATNTYLPMVRAGKYGEVAASVGTSDEFIAKLSQPDVPPRKIRKGAVRGRDTSIFDDDGQFHALGASLMWATSGYRNARDELERDLETLADAGFDYIRVLGVVGCPGPGLDACGRAGATDAWDGKEADWRWPDFDAVIAGLTDLAYDKYGLRVEWTLIGDGQYNIPNRNDRFNLVDRFLAMSRGREHKIMHFEIANEAWQNGFGGDSGVQQLRELTRYMNDRTDILVAASAMGAECNGGTSEVETLYAGGIADLATMHYSRNTREDGWRPVRQPWGFHECRGVPKLASNNEPIGPGSSVASDTDPVRLAAAAVATYISKQPFYVFHSRRGVGIGRNFGFEASWPMDRMTGFDAFKAMKTYLPADITSWSRQNHYWADHPFETYGNGKLNEMWPDTNGPNGVTRHFAAVNGGRFVTLPIGIRNFVEIAAKRNMEFDVLHPVTGEVVAHHVLNGGDRIRLSGLGAFVLIGNYR